MALHSHNRLSPESGPGVLLDVIPIAAHLSSVSEIRDVLSGEGFSVAGGSAGHEQRLSKACKFSERDYG